MSPERRLTSGFPFFPMKTGLLLILGVALAQEPVGYRISADVDHVVLPVTVVDGKGEFVPGLEKENFRVFEDSKPQEITFFSHRDIPITVGLVVDASGSMREKRPDTVLSALHFVRLSNPEDEVFTISFNEKSVLGLGEDEPFTNNAGRLRDSLLDTTCSGRTALYDALLAALEHVEKGSRDKKVLILVSDGGDNASRHRFEDVLEAAARSNVIIYTIGLYTEGDADRNPGVLKKLAQRTGGETYLPQQTKELAPICAHIAKEIRTQYTLGYSPLNPAHDGSYRRIRVAPTAPDRRKLTARTRPGYYAPGSQEQARNPQP